MKPPKSPRSFNSTLPARTSRLASSTPMERGAMTRKRRTKAEQTAKLEREYGGESRLSWVASLPCSVMGCGRTPSENCHATTGGMGRKASADSIFPACRVHHAELHQVGVRTWEAMHRLDVLALAAHTERQWQRHQSDLTPLSRIVPGVVARLRGEA